MMVLQPMGCRRTEMTAQMHILIPMLVIHMRYKNPFLPERIEAFLFDGSAVNLMGLQSLWRRRLYIKIFVLEIFKRMYT